MRPYRYSKVDQYGFRMSRSSEHTARTQLKTERNKARRGSVLRKKAAGKREMRNYE